ncbi:MAG: hypothetical protein ACK456_16755 [Pseudanabaenaceae cyanobacterium]|jgi:hypothetical protein
MTQKFSYKVVEIRSGDLARDLEAKLNQLGGEGWQIVDAADNGEYRMVILQKSV